MILKNRYEIFEKLGVGAFGAVHRALDHSTGSAVAVKFLTKTETLDRFQNEARQLYQQINNRYVVKLIDFDFGDVQPFLVLEYCAGGSLRVWVGQTVPWQQIAFALSCAVSGLRELHKNNGFHRDLKPDNLLITIDPETGLDVVKIGDFGLARIPDAVSMTYSPGGTYNYMAPEVLEACLRPNHVSYKYSPSADIYSLGITVLELLTGSTELKELQRAPAPQGLLTLVECMCSVEPERRPGTDHIAQELSRLLAPPTPGSSSSPSGGGQGTGQPAGDGTVAGIVAGVGLGALALLALAALLGEKKEWDPDVERYRGPDGRFRRR